VSASARGSVELVDATVDYFATPRADAASPGSASVSDDSTIVASGAVLDDLGHIDPQPAAPGPFAPAPMWARAPYPATNRGGYRCDRDPARPARRREHTVAGDA